MRTLAGWIALFLSLLPLSPAVASSARWVTVQRPPTLVRTGAILLREVDGLPVYIQGAPSRYHIIGAVFIDDDDFDDSIHELVAKGAEHGAEGLILFSPSDKRANPKIYTRGIWAWCYR
ncbi:hypothetical protein MAMC_00667 [Methylacidimicrobium cyclopophantes]|uniref:Uncharacterized protein n=1 Tax=Methylacidimicrobium cyclopophantes TaxID=1041766 RepID=A0A5E6M8I5_9BACT|nr:hypothetical protein [Methylacidimicrobium cyclopophantes]VVM05557.1 hypothetical protein MAMC_00667 [Methylacidimicrobium cyclopophantes]